MATPRFTSRVAWLVLPLLAIVFFIQPIWRGEVLIPSGIQGVVDDVWQSNQPAKNPLLSDVLYQFYPWQTFLFDHLRSGELPLWNPHQLAGMPFLANHQSAPFDIVRLLTFVFGFSAAGSFLPAAVIRLALFGLFTALWLQRRGFERNMAIILSATVMFSAPMIAWISYPLFASFLWLPLVLFGAETLKTRRWLGTGVVAIGTAAHFFGGNIQMSLFTVLFVLAYVVVMLPKKQALLTLGGILVGTMFAAVQLLPTLAFIRQSQTFETGRSGYASTNILDAAQSGKWNGWKSVADVKREAKRLLPMVMPEVFGNPAKQSYQFPDQTVQNNFNELAGSAGLAALWLAVYGAIVAWRERGVKFFSISTGVILGMISHAPVFELLNYLPVINQTSTGRLRFFIAFSIVVLAGYGLQSILKKVVRWPLVLSSVAVIGVALGVTAFVMPKASQPAGFFTIGLTVAGILAIVWRKINQTYKYLIAAVIFIGPSFWMLCSYNTSVKANTIFPPNTVTTQVEAVGDTSRVVGVTKNDRRSPLVPNTAMSLGVNDVRGYEVVRLRRFEELTKDVFIRSGSYLRGVEQPHPVLNLLSAQTGLMAIQDVAELSPAFLEAGWEMSSAQNNIVLLSNPTAFPRAFFIQHPALVTPGELDPVTFATQVTRPDQSVIETTGRYERSAPAAVAEAKIVSESANQVEMSVNAPADGYVILNDSYDKGWQAWVDEKRTEVLPANYAFRAVAVPAGKHKIVFQYKPTSFVIGMWVSLGTLVSLLIAAWFSVFRRRLRRVAMV